MENERQDNRSDTGNRGLDLINGPVFQTTIRLAIPIIIANFLNLAIGIADIAMVGHIQVNAKEALAALVTSNQLLNLINALGFGIGFAAITHVSQHTGAGRHLNARRSASHVIMTGVILGLIMMSVGIPALPYLLGIVNPEPLVFEYAESYLGIIFNFLPLFFLIFMGVAIMHGLGDTLTPMIIMGCVNAVNILLNYMLIYGAWGAPELGIEGAAIGSTIARGLGVLTYLIILFSGKYRIVLRLPDFQPYLMEFWGLLRLGLPNSLHSISRNMNVLLLYRVLSYTEFPTVAQASLGVGFHSEALGFIPLIGLFMATGTMVGQNLGAKKTERAEQAAWAALKSGFFLMTIVCILFLAIPEKIVGAFNTDPDVIYTGSWYLRINAITQIFQSAFVLIGCLRGAGDSIRPLYGHFIGQWIIRLPLAYFLAFHAGLEEWGVWLAMAASSAVECLIYFWLFKKGDWKKMSIGSDEEVE